MECPASSGIITATDKEAITFNSGAVYVYNISISTANPFGTGTDSSVVFASGSKLVGVKGGDLFGGAGHTVVEFRAGSIYETQGTSSYFTQLDGRTFANYIYNGTSGNTASGSVGFTMDSLIIVNTGSGNFNITEMLVDNMLVLHL